MTRTSVLLALVVLVLGANAYWFLLSVPIVTDQPVRTVVGALLIFLLPGLVWGEILGLRSRMPLETIALAFALTLTLEIGLLLAVLPLGVAIEVWVGLLLGVTAVGVGLLIRRARRGVPFDFATGLLTLPGGSWADRIVHAACVLVPLLLAGVAYRWAEVVDDLGGEKLIHMMFVRYYAEMPLVLRDLAIDRNLTPANLVHLWEFLLAGWSRCIRCDPLPLFCHARFVVPLLGFAGMYLLTRMVFVARRKTAAVFAGILVLCAAQLVLAAPSLAWVNTADPTRGVFAFLGTAHHADTAMDLLIALSMGVVLLWMRRPCGAHLLLLVGVLAANFLWHPREFLQLSLYLGILGLAALLLPSLRQVRLWKRGLATVAILIGVAVGATALSLASAGRESHGYDEIGLKRQSIAYATKRVHLGTTRSLFNFPGFYCLSSTLAPDRVETSAETLAHLRSEWHYDLWLFLAAGAMVWLGIAGDRRDRQLALYQFLLWFLALCWNASVLAILALTYSEFFHTTQRLLYLIAYLTIADAFVVLGTTCHAGAGQALRGLRIPHLGSVAAVAAMLGIGFALRAWVRAGQPAEATVAMVLTTASFFLLGLALRDRPFRLLSGRQPSLALMVTLLLAGLLPFSGWHLRRLVELARRPAPPELSWFAPGNPFGYSPDFIDWLRALPPGHKLLTNPLHQDVPCIYSPQYLAIHATTSVIKDIAERASVLEGRHPIFSPYYAGGNAAARVDHARAIAWLRDHRVDYVVVSRQDLTLGLDRYFRQHADVYSLAFASDSAREVVFQVRGAAPGS